MQTTNNAADAQTQPEKTGQADIPWPVAPHIEFPKPIEIVEENNGPVGIGGWLILPILHLVSTIGLTAWNFLQAPWGGVKIILIDLAPQYADRRLPVAISIITGAAYLGWAITALVHMFKRSPRIPTIMTIYYLGGFLVTISDIIATSMLSSSGGGIDDMDMKALVRTFIAAAIWIPYFHTSKRVANTFKSPEARVSEQIDTIFS